MDGKQIMTVAMCLIISLFDFQTQQSWTWFWSSSAWRLAPLLSQWRFCWCGWPTVAGQSGCSTLQLHHEPAVAVCGQEMTWSYRDQGGTTANYTDHVLTKIAADNYISQQTVEQSIILTVEQKRPVVSASIGQTRRWGAIQFTPPLIGGTAVAVEFHT